MSVCNKNVFSLSVTSSSYHNSFSCPWPFVTLVIVAMEIANSKTFPISWKPNRSWTPYFFWEAIDWQVIGLTVSALDHFDGRFSVLQKQTQWAGMPNCFIYWYIPEYRIVPGMEWMFSKQLLSDCMKLSNWSKPRDYLWSP